MAAKGFQSPGVNDVVSLTSLEDFDSSIPFDDLQVFHFRINYELELGNDM